MREFLADWSKGEIGNATTAMITQFNRLVAEDGASNNTPTDRIQFVDCPWHPGKLALLMTVHQHDVDGGVVKERVQITSFASSGRFYVEDGDDVWIAFSVMLAPNFVFPLEGGYVVILDGFPNTADLEHSGKNSAIEISLGEFGAGPVWRLNVNGGVSTDGGETYPHDTDVTITPAKLNVRNDFLIRYKMSSGSDGQVEVWYAAGDANFPTTPNATDSGVNVCTANGFKCVMYPEFGLYRSTREPISSVVFGGIKINPSRKAAEEIFIPTRSSLNGVKESVLVPARNSVKSGGNLVVQ